MIYNDVGTAMGISVCTRTQKIRFFFPDLSELLFPFVSHKVNFSWLVTLLTTSHIAGSVVTKKS